MTSPNLRSFLIHLSLVVAITLIVCASNVTSAATATVNNTDELVAAINNPDIDVILLAGPVDYDMKAYGQITINQKQTFRSADGTPRNILWDDRIIPGTGTAVSIFRFGPGADGTTFENIHFNHLKSARTSEISGTPANFYGGILYANASMTFKNANFSGNDTALTYNFAGSGAGRSSGWTLGGGIYLYSKALTFEGDATFENNRLQVTYNNQTQLFGETLTMNDIRGGILYSTNGSVLFKNDAAFRNNKVSVYDNVKEKAIPPNPARHSSAILRGSLVYASNSDFTFLGDSVFENNEIFIRKYISDAANVTHLCTGLIHSTGQSVFNFVGKTRFNDNFFKHYTYSDDVYYSDYHTISGGCIYNDSGNVTFWDTAEFSGNKSPGSVEGMAIKNMNKGVVTFNGAAVFRDNIVFYRDADNPGLRTPPSYGLAAAILNSGVGSKIHFNAPTLFQNNIIQSAILGQGAAIVNDRGTININATTEFRGNKVLGLDSTGGAIGNSGIINVNLSNPGEYVLFDGNMADDRAQSGYAPTRNAINMYESYNAFPNTAILQLNHVMGTDVYFYDPITSYEILYDGIISNGQIIQDKCGTTHFIGNKSDYYGNTTINKGYFQLERGAVFGNYDASVRGQTNMNTFAVTEHGALNGDGTFKADTINIDGMLLPGFYLDKGYYSYEKGASLHLDAQTALTLGSNTVYKPLLWADGAANFVTTSGVTPIVDPDASMFLNFRPGRYSGSVTYASTLTGFDANNVTYAPFINAGYDSGSGVITYDGFVRNYFTDIGITKNQKGVGAGFDQLITGDLNDEVWDYLTRTAIAWERFGDPSLLKFYDAASGAQRANTLMMATMFPKDIAWKQIGPGLRYNGSRCVTDDTLYRLQNARRGAPAGYGISSQDMWFQPHYQSLRVGGDGNCGGYSVDQTGFLLGNNKAILPGTYWGAFIGYAMPEMIAEDFYAKSHNISIGSLIGRHFQNHWELKAWGIAGYQHYDMRRAFDRMNACIGSGDCIPFGADTDYDKTLRGRTDGWTLATGFEMGKILAQRPCQFSWLRYRPFFGFDYEHVTQAGFSERGDHPLRLAYQKENFDQAQFHFGASALIDTRFCSLDGRIMYTNVIGGDAGPSSGAEFATMPGGAFTVDGVNLGYHYLNLGINGDIYLNARRSKVLTCAFETSFGRHSQYNAAALTYSQYY